MDERGGVLMVGCPECGSENLRLIQPIWDHSDIEVVTDCEGCGAELMILAEPIAIETVRAT